MVIFSIYTYFSESTAIGISKPKYCFCEEIADFYLELLSYFMYNIFRLRCMLGACPTDLADTITSV